MNNIKSKQIEVWANWHTITEPVLVGVLNVHLSRGKEIFSFEYEPTWLKSPYAFGLDPAFTLVSSS